jgi:hypothetical protein
MRCAIVLVCALILSGCTTPPMTTEQQVAAFGPLLPAPSAAELDTAKALNLPRYLQMPSLDEMHAAYPRTAWAEDAEGRVELDCIVQSSGRLACVAGDDGHPRYDFELSALLLSTRLRVGLEDENGESAVGRRLSVPLAFRLH